MTQNPNYDKLWTIIRDINIAMLTTVTENGGLRSRPMATQQTAFDGSLWFFTSDDAPKVDEMMRERDVSLSYADPQNQAYVSVSGKARFHDDFDLKKQLWNESARPWFSGGPEDPDLLVLQVRVESAEYWDVDKMAMQGLFSAAGAAPGGDSIADHEKLPEAPRRYS